MYAMYTMMYKMIYKSWQKMAKNKLYLRIMITVINNR